MEATIYFSANQFSAAKLFPKQTRFSFIMIDVFLATGSREKINGRISREFVAAVVVLDSLPIFFQFCFSYISQRKNVRALSRE